MSNSYYNYDNSLTPGTKAKAEDVIANLQAVQSGFDQIPSIASLTGGALTGSSVTSVAIGTGAKTFAMTGAARSWVVGTRLGIASAANPANFMEGQVTAYSGASLTVNVLGVGGAGTFSDWQIGIAGTVFTPVSVPNGGTGGTTAATARTGLNIPANTVAQGDTAFTTGGAGPNFTLTPTPALGAYTAGTRYRVNFSGNGAGADQLNISGLGNKALKQYDSTGAKIAATVKANMLADVDYDGVDLVVLDALPAAAYPVGGVARNGCYNGSCRVLAEAAKSLTTSPLYAKVDMWAAWASGGAVSAGSITQDAASTIGTYGKSLFLSGVTLTGAGVLSVRQRIPALDAAFYKNKTCTFSAHVLQDTGGALNYTVIVRKPTVADNYGAVTVISTGTAQSVATATDTQVSSGTSTAAPSFAMGDCSNGIEIEIQVACGAMGPKNFRFADMQLEEGTSATEFEQQPLSVDMTRCGLMFEKTYAQGTDPAAATRACMIPLSATGGTNNEGYGFRWRYPKRPGAAPTLAVWDGAGTSNKNTAYNASGFIDGFMTLSALQSDENSAIMTSSISSNAPIFLHYTCDVRL